MTVDFTGSGPIHPHNLNATPAMSSRGRHQSTSKECHRMIRQIEGIHGVIGVIIGRSYGGKSLGSGNRTGSIRIQRHVPGGIKAVTQSAKGLQELFIRTEPGTGDAVAEKIVILGGNRP